jgi:hypothetical protein
LRSVEKAELILDRWTSYYEIGAVETFSWDLSANKKV